MDIKQLSNRMYRSSILSTLLLVSLIAISLITLYSVKLMIDTNQQPTITYVLSEKSSKPKVPVVPDELVVRFEPGVNNENKVKITSENKMKNIGGIPDLDIGVFKVNPSEKSKAKENLERNPNIKYVEDSYYTETAYTPNDPSVNDGKQWQLPLIQAYGAWDQTQGENVTIAVLDSGVDAEHPDLSGRLVQGYSLYDTPETVDLCGHGTMVAGIAAASGDNDQGIAGISYKSSIMPVKIVYDTCSGSYSRTITGINYAVNNGADVIVISSGAGVYSTSLHDAVKYARDNGVLIAAAAGNRANSEPFYPAAHPEAIAVSGTSYDDAFYSYSTYGPFIDVAAPASPVYTTYIGGSYGNGGGTSFASPHVGGLIGLIKSLHPEYEVTDIEYILENSSDDLGDPGFDDYYGYGRINLANALLTTPPGYTGIGDTQPDDNTGIGDTAPEEPTKKTPPGLLKKDTPPDDGTPDDGTEEPVKKVPPGQEKKN